MSDAKHTARSILDDCSDEALAYRVRMLMRNDLMHEAIVCAARDRILKLAAENTRLRDMHDELVGACKSWVDYFDKLDRDSEPGDRLAEVRRQFHSNRVEATRAALARAGQAVPS